MTAVAKPKTTVELMALIEQTLPQGGDWCPLLKAQTLAAAVLALRPEIVVEIGVWRGASLIPMLLAMDFLERGMAIAIDPWSVPAAVKDEREENVQWWTDRVGHDGMAEAKQIFVGRLHAHGLAPRCLLLVKPSDDVTPPTGVGLLHVDGNHADQAVRDVERFGAGVLVGGLLVLDDLKWTGGHVQKARARARELGFEDLYPLGSGLAMQRVRA